MKVAKRSLRWIPRGVGGALLLSTAVVLNLYSGESLTLTTSYPAPSGIYMTLTTTGNTVLARDGGRVGIGNSAPSGTLHVGNREANNHAAIYVDSQNAGTWISYASAGTNPGTHPKAGAIGNSFQIQTGGANGVGQGRLTVLQDGRVGIGTAAPAAGVQLDVQGGAIQAGGGFILEVRNNDPANPAVGRMWLRQ